MSDVSKKLRELLANGDKMRDSEYRECLQLLFDYINERNDAVFDIIEMGDIC